MKSNALRWLAVAPAALLSAVAASFALHWTLYLSLAHGDVISGVDIRPIEYATYPFAIAVGFVYGGSRSAPTHRLRTAVTLAILWFGAMLAIFIFAPALRPGFGARTAGAVAGALLAVSIAWRQEADER